MHTYIHMCVHTHTHYMRTCTQTDIHTCVHTHTYMRTYTYIHTYLHTCLHMHAYKHTHTCVHTYVHTAYIPCFFFLRAVNVRSATVGMVQENWIANTASVEAAGVLQRLRSAVAAFVEDHIANRVSDPSSKRQCEDFVECLAEILHDTAARGLF